jgi:hypothetical protein
MKYEEEKIDSLVSTIPPPPPGSNIPAEEEVGPIPTNQ